MSFRSSLVPLIRSSPLFPLRAFSTTPTHLFPSAEPSSSSSSPSSSSSSPLPLTRSQRQRQQNDKNMLELLGETYLKPAIDAVTSAASSGSLNPLLPPSSSPSNTPSSSSTSYSSSDSVATNAEPNLPKPGYDVNALPPRVDPIVELFTNMLMRHGRKAEAKDRMSEILEGIRQNTHSDPLPILHSTLLSISPSLRLRSVKRSAKNIPIPTALDARQRAHAGISWLLKAAEAGRNGTLTRTERIVREVLRVREGSTSVLDKKAEVHRLGAVNRSNLITRA